MLTKAALSAETLAGVFEQSVDCVKLIGLDGGVMWMNANGMCAMDIDDFCTVGNRHWSSLWPEESAELITDGLTQAATGYVVRFDAYCPTAKGTPRWWNVCISRVDDAQALHAGYLTISRDITEMVMARRALELSVDEMRHRIKNTYAVIGGLLTAFAGDSPEKRQFAREMEKRLVAICRAQTAIFEGDQACDLAELLPALVAPFHSDACSVKVADMPAIQVDAGRAEAIALVLGELAVNATKYGALVAGGSVRVEANTDARALTIIWRELSNAAVATDRREGGQGLGLIGKIVRARGGTFDIEWHSHGLTATVSFPTGARS
jgi:two-component sensor histidine kinase